MTRQFDPFATETETMRLMKKQLARELEPAPESYQEKKEMKEKISTLEAENARLKEELSEVCEDRAEQVKEKYNLKTENARLKQEKAELVEALEDGLKQMDYQCQATASAYEGCEDCETWCEVYNWKKKARAALERMKEG